MTTNKEQRPQMRPEGAAESDGYRSEQIMTFHASMRQDTTDLRAETLGQTTVLTLDTIKGERVRLTLDRELAEELLTQLGDELLEQDRIQREAAFEHQQDLIASAPAFAPRLAS